MNENSYEFAFENGPLVLPPPVAEFADRDPADSSSLLLLAGPSAARSGWAARAAVSFAEALAARGRRLVLGDLGLDEPGLHELLGGGNQEGMADIFLYGASLRRVARPAGDGSYYFVAAGPYAPDPAEVMRHPRWGPVLDGLGDSGITLVAYAPADIAGIESLTERIRDVVVLAEPDEAGQTVAVLPPGRAPLAALVPAGSPDADALVDALVADPADRQENGAAWPDMEDIGPDAEEPESRGWPDLEWDDSPPAETGSPPAEEDALRAEASPFDAEPSPFDAGAPPFDQDAGLVGEDASRTEADASAADAEHPPSDADAPIRAEESAAGDEPVEGPTEEADPSTDRLWQARERRRGTEPDQVPEPVTPPRREETLKEPGFVRRDQPRKRSSALLLVLLAVALVAGGWFVADRLGVIPARGTQQPAEPAGAPEAEPAADVGAVEAESARESEFGISLGEPLGFSVAIEAHQDFDLAEERIDMLTEAEPDVAFYLAPISVDNVVYYRVLAGPTSESSAAERLMRRLVDAGHKSQVQAWDVRPTAWAYEIGDYGEIGEARDRRQELREQGVPSYIVEVPYSGATRYRLYAGAYSGPTEAEVMGDILRRAGVDAPFERRMGRPVP